MVIMVESRWVTVVVYDGIIQTVNPKSLWKWSKISATANNAVHCFQAIGFMAIRVGIPSNISKWITDVLEFFTIDCKIHNSVKS